MKNKVKRSSKKYKKSKRKYTERKLTRAESREIDIMIAQDEAESRPDLPFKRPNVINLYMPNIWGMEGKSPLAYNSKSILLHSRFRIGEKRYNEK